MSHKNRIYQHFTQEELRIKKFVYLLLINFENIKEHTWKMVLLGPLM